MRDAAPPPAGPPAGAPPTKPAPFSSRLLGMKFMRRAADARATAQAASEAAAADAAAKWTVAESGDAARACVLVREADPTIVGGSGRRRFGPEVEAGAHDDDEDAAVVDGADVNDSEMVAALGHGDSKPSKQGRRRPKEGVSGGHVSKKSRRK